MWRRIGCTTAAVLLASCSFDWAGFDPRHGAAGGVANVGGMGATGGGAEGGDPSVAGNTGAGAAGGNIGAWLAPGFQRRRLLTIANDSGEALTDVPVLISVGGSIDVSAAQPDGDDLRFFDSTGEPLAHEVELWSTNGGAAWLELTVLDPSGATVEMYYGNAAAPNGADAAGVWSNGYAAVWHMAGNADATGNHPLANGGASDTAGVIGRARSFDGIGDYMDVSAGGDLEDVMAAGATVSAWIAPSGPGGGGFGRIVDKSSGPTTQGGWALYILESASAPSFRRAHSTSDGIWYPGGVNLGNATHVALSYQDGSPPTFFIDGQSVSATTDSTPVGTPSNDTGHPMRIGNASMFTDKGFHGVIDEVRIATVQRSAAWMRIQYASMTNQLISYGAEQLEP